MRKIVALALTVALTLSFSDIWDFFGYGVGQDLDKDIVNSEWK